MVEAAGVEPAASFSDRSHFSRYGWKQPIKMILEPAEVVFDLRILEHVMAGKGIQRGHAKELEIEVHGPEQVVCPPNQNLNTGLSAGHQHSLMSVSASSLFQAHH